MAFVTAPLINYSNPAYVWSQYDKGSASGLAEINPGDYVSWSGHNLIASHDGITYFKASGAGIAVDRNPAYDAVGAQVNNSALIYARMGKFRVSAAFSGNPLKGVLAFPDMTGSGVNAPSGNTGLGAIWNTALPVNVSGGTAAAPSKAVAQVVAWYGDQAVAGTGQMDIQLWDRNADYY